MTGSVRDRILAVDDLGSEDVEVEEWGETLTVRGLTAGEVEEFGRQANEGTLTNIMPTLVAMTVINGTGERMFSDDDIEQLAGKSPAAIKTLFDAAQRLSGIGDIEEMDSGN